MRSLQSVIILMLGIISCTNYPSSYTIQGTLPDGNFDGETIYMLRYDDNTFVDSAVVSGRDFVFEGVADTPEYCRIQAGRLYYANLILENGEIVVDFNNHTASSTTPLNKQQNQMVEEAEKLDMEFTRKGEELKATVSDPEQFEELMTDYYETHLRKEYAKLYKSYFYANRDNVVGVNALQEYFHVASPDAMDSLFAKASGKILSRESVKKLRRINTALKNTAVGKPFKDFTVEQEEGENLSLSDYVGKGKYVLVDFWASWCGACVEELPTIAELYRNYNDKGLEVLGVAMWDRLSDSHRALEMYDMPWSQILNAQNIPSELYGISSLPHIILFAPDGTIIARNLRGEKLKAKIEEELN